MYSEADKIATEFSDRAIKVIWDSDLDFTIDMDSFPELERQRALMIDEIRKTIKRDMEVNDKRAEILLVRWLTHGKLYEMVDESEILDTVLTENGDNPSIRYQFNNYLNDKKRTEEILKDLNRIVKLPVEFSMDKSRPRWNSRRLELTYRDIKIKISKRMFEKLEDSYEGDKRKFVERLFNCVYRYDYIGGLDTYQAAAPKKFFDYIQYHFGVQHECFASPLNRTLENYTSQYFDVDKYFGSLGSFYDLKHLYPEGGSFQANPPYIEEVIGIMVRYFIRWLDEDKKNPLSFIIILPNWTDSSNVKMLTESEYLRLEHFLGISDHRYTIYCPGNVRRKNICNTRIYILQNDLGNDLWPIKENIKEDLNRIFS